MARLMNLAVVILMLAVAAPAMAQPAGKGKGKHGHKHQKENRCLRPLQEAMDQLEEAEQMLNSGQKLSKAEVRDIQLLIKDARLKIREFMLESDRCLGEEDGPEPVEVDPEVVAPPPEVVLVPMNPETFETLMEGMDREGFSDAKLAVLTTASQSNYFLVAQARRVLDELSFPSDKLAALKILKPRLVDPENAFQLVSCFVHNSDKEEARKILEVE